MLYRVGASSVPGYRGLRLGSISLGTKGSDITDGLFRLSSNVWFSIFLRVCDFDEWSEVGCDVELNVLIHAKWKVSVIDSLNMLHCRKSCC